MDKKKEKMTPERRYELACLILGGVVLGGALGCILRPNEWTFAVIPLLGVCLTALLWCAAARLWLCRDKQRLLAVTKSDLLDEELTEAIRSELPDVPSVFISAVSGYNLQTLKDMLWEALQKENT